MQLRRETSRICGSVGAGTLDEEQAVRADLPQAVQRLAVQQRDAGVPVSPLQTCRAGVNVDLRAVLQVKPSARMQGTGFAWSRGCGFEPTSQVRL